MKKFLLILFLFITFENLGQAATNPYYTYPNYTQRALMRPTYNPYSTSYKNPYFYRKYNRNNTKRIQKINKLRQINRIKNTLSTWNRNNYNNGTLTGYSLPITSDFYNQTYTQNPTLNNLKHNTNLFSIPSSGNLFFEDGRYIIRNKATTGTTGVKIIYD